MKRQDEHINWLTPKLYKGISMHEQEMRSFRFRFTQFFKKLWRKLEQKLHPDKSFEEWKKRVKTPDELTPKERREWYEEEMQMWKDYWEDLL